MSNTIHQVRKTIVIGLGGTGRDAVLNIKRKYQEVYGTDDVPTTRFLVLDTTGAQPLQFGDGHEVRIKPGEFRKMSVANPRQVVKINKDVKGWFPEGGVPLAAITSGAGQIRAIGRLALFANSNDVYSALANVFDDVRGIKPNRDIGNFEVIGDNVLVSVVGSLSGGTGSGTFLDVAYLCRTFLDAEDTLVGYLLLPDVFVGKPATRNVQPNAYGALKELDYLMSRTMSQSDDAFDFGGQTIRRDSAPFDVVYLVNNQNKAKYVTTEVEELTELLGTGIFVSSGAAGKAAGDVWDNLRSFLSARGNVDGKKSSYSSFGVSELVLDTDGFANQLAMSIGIRALERGFLGLAESDIVEAVDEFIDENELREHEADQVIDSISGPNEFSRFRSMEDVGKGNIDELFRNGESHLSNIRSRTSAEIAKRVEAAKEEKLEALQTYVDDRLAKPSQLQFIRRFLSTLQAKLEEYRDEMGLEREDFRQRLEAMESRQKKFNEDAEAGQKRFFGASKALTELAQNYESFINDRCRATVEVERRDGANGLFSVLIAEVKREQDRLSDLSNRIESLLNQMTGKLERLRSQGGKARPFTIQISPPKEDLDVENAAHERDLLTWIREKGQSVRELAAMQSEDLERFIFDFSYSRPIVSRVADMRINDVLRRMPDDELARLVKQLDQLAVPNWRYNEAYMTGPRSTDTIYLFGVESVQDSVFDADTLGTMLPGASAKPQFTSIADPHRILCYKVEGAVPAFIVDGMSTYKRYYESPDASFTYHIDREWESVPDLWPSGDEENRWVWSVANASPFDLVSNTGSFYYAKSKKLGKATEGYEIRLGQGRENALKAFIDDSKLVAEFREEIEAATRQRGVKDVERELNEYVEELKSTRVGSAAVKSLIEQEIKDIEQYVKDIVSVY